jgi:probable F420-dependent oxidoreductase
MDFGLCLPNFPAGASPEGLEAAGEVVERLGWSTIWTTDHVIVNHAGASEYGRIYEAITTLAWLGARHPRVRLGTSVIVVPQRNAVLLAKELATLDSLSGGRVTAGIGVGWNRAEFANLGMADRFHVRGVYVEETIRLWRHLWSGSTEPFSGRFHPLEDFEFAPLPDQGAALPILVGGRAEVALQRAGRMADGYHSSSTAPAEYAPRVPVVLAAAEAAGRPAPWFSSRVRVEFDGTDERFYALRGSPDEMAAEVRAFADLGVSHLALWFATTDPAELVERAERFDREVVPLV